MVASCRMHRRRCRDWLCGVVGVYVVYVPALHPIHLSEMFFVLVPVGFFLMFCKVLVHLRITVVLRLMAACWCDLHIYKAHLFSPDASIPTFITMFFHLFMSFFLLI